MVGPSGSRKTQLVFSIFPPPTTFYPPIVKTYYFSKDYQPLFKQMSENIDIEFVPYLDFEKIKKLHKCLHAVDDSCEELYQEKKCKSCKSWLI